MNSTTIVSTFRKSSFSGGGSANECVEIARTVDGGRAVRDSKDPAKGIQHFGIGAWRAFVAQFAAERCG